MTPLAPLPNHRCSSPGNSKPLCLLDHSTPRAAVCLHRRPLTVQQTTCSTVSWTRPGCCYAAPQHQQHQPQQAQQQLQQAAASSDNQQLQYPLVERKFDHNWRSPLAGHDHPDPSCRPVLALGKFDALHKGHQALAAAALQLGGTPVLLSFSGMAAVLGWAPRKPLVAPCDRPRVLDLWAQQLAQQRLEQQQKQQQRRRKRPLADDAAAAAAVGVADGTSSGDAAVQQQPRAGSPSQPAVRVVPVRQRYIPFAAVRSLSPEAFVDHIRQDFRAAGVVSGVNYRFGYRAAGDAALLQQLCGEADLPVSIVEMVGAATPGAVGPVSSTKIREMLDSCRMEAVKRSLGRPYRLVADINLADWQQQERNGYSSSSSSGSGSAGTPLLHPGSVFVPTHQLLNQHPAAGVFLCDLLLFVGATAHDDLLQLQRAVRDGCSSSGGSGSSGGGDAGVSGSSGSSSSSSIQVLPVAGSSGCKWCVRAAQQQVEVWPGGILVPQAVWEAAESCLNSAADNGSSSSSVSNTGSSYSSDSSSTSSGRRVHGTDPLVWDTDDRDNEEEESEGASRDGAGARLLNALLVIDIESCLMQTCTFP